MRLLDTTTLMLYGFAESEIPAYAILSHTWGSDEVSLQDLINGRGREKEGYKKIEKCCSIAFSDGFKYAWIDTCCIDKTSSAELSEAINSMYAWYRHARVCYVILSDVPFREDHTQPDSAFRESRWFKRGWTLQELIAPEVVIFYAKDWTEIGTKVRLCDLVHEITGIKTGLLRGRLPLSHYSVAQKMSWAAGRRTTRIEDIAYCLLGLFDVNMPLLYGEGKKAFFRLQEQILSSSSDESIFAWMVRLKSRNMTGSCLAQTPNNFSRSGDIVTLSPDVADVLPATYSMSNKGLNMIVQAYPVDEYRICIMLNCMDETSLTPIRLIFDTNSPASDLSTGPKLYRRSFGVFEPTLDGVPRRDKIFMASILLSLVRPSDPNPQYQYIFYYVNTIGFAQNDIQVQNFERYHTNNAPLSRSTASIIRPLNDKVVSIHFKQKELDFYVLLRARYSPSPDAMSSTTYPRAIITEREEYYSNVKASRLNNDWMGNDSVIFDIPHTNLQIKLTIRPRDLDPMAMVPQSWLHDLADLTILNRSRASAIGVRVDMTCTMKGDDTGYTPMSLDDLNLLQRHHAGIIPRPRIERLGF